MDKRAIAINGVTIAAGVALTCALFIANNVVSDTGVPRPVLELLASPAFLVPSIIVTACVIVVVVFTSRHFSRTRMSSTNDQPTGFRVGKKTLGGT